jgi:hypothetical protein
VLQGIKVLAGMYGTVKNIYDYNNPNHEGPKFLIGGGQAKGYWPGRIDIEDRATKQNVLYGHLTNIPPGLGTKGHEQVTPGTLLGELDSVESHVHLEVWDDSIAAWGPMINPLPYFSPALQAQLIADAREQNDDRVTFFQNETKSIPQKWRGLYTQDPIERRGGFYLARFGYVGD